MRVKVTAVNTDVAMPISSTTAKPFTGPEPSSSMMTPDNGVGDVGFEDRPAGFLIAELDRLDHASPAPPLLADAFVDQHVGVDRGADRQHEAGDAGQGQRAR